MSGSSQIDQLVDKKHTRRGALSRIFRLSFDAHYLPEPSQSRLSRKATFGFLAAERPVRWGLGGGLSIVRGPDQLMFAAAGF